MSTSNQWLVLGGAFSRFFSDGGPTHSDLDGVFALAGYAEPAIDPRPTKPQRVVSAFRSSDDGTRSQVTEELKLLLERKGYLDDPDRTEVRQLQGALSRVPLDRSSTIHDRSSVKTPIDSDPAVAPDSVPTRHNNVTGGESIIFISHSTADRDIAQRLIDLLRIITGADERIFCTSVQGYEISSGADWLEQIRLQLERSALTVFVVTKHFRQSEFCHFELGATWSQADENARFPIVFPPVTTSWLDPILARWQSPQVSEHVLERLLERAVERLDLAMPAPNRVGRAVRRFMDEQQRAIYEAQEAEAFTETNSPESFSAIVSETNFSMRGVDVVHPTIKVGGGEAGHSIERLFSTEVDARVNAFIAAFADRQYQLNDEVHNVSFTMDAEVTHVSPSLLSAVLPISWFSGGANPMQEVLTLNLDPRSGAHLNLGDLLRLDGDDLHRFTSALSEQLRARERIDGSFRLALTRPFRVSEGLGFAFDKYELGSGHLGAQKLVCDTAQLTDIARATQTKVALLS